MVLISFMAIGQNVTQKEIPFIEVIGTAQKEVIPNEIYINISIQERIENKDKITIEEQEAVLKKALERIDIPIENLSLAEASSNYQSVKWSKKDVIAKTDYILKVEDAMAVGDVFSQLDKLKIINAYVAKVSHSDIVFLKKEVRVTAIKAAKEKAEYLLDAIGEEIGKALIVKEEQVYSSGNIRCAHSNASNYYVNSVEVKKNEDFIQYEKIVLEASMYIKFSIQ